MGALLMWLRPNVVAIDCDQCHLIMYDLDTGKPEMWRGQPAKRAKGVPPPCKRCPKQGPDSFSTLLPQNIECVQHYLECSATGSFPDDPLVRRHAAILKAVERQVEKAERDDEFALTAIRHAAAQAMTSAARTARSFGK